MDGAIATDAREFCCIVFAMGSHHIDQMLSRWKEPQGTRQETTRMWVMALKIQPSFTNSDHHWQMLPNPSDRPRA